MVLHRTVCQGLSRKATVVVVEMVEQEFPAGDRGEASLPGKAQRPAIEG
jgi:hypothetical protein